MNMDVKHIANLAKLQISDDKIQEFERQSKQLLGMVDDLPEIDGEFTVDANNVMSLRPDEIAPSLSRDDVLKNAPKAQAGCIVVPKTVG